MALGFFSKGSIYLRWLRNSLLVTNAIAAMICTGLLLGLTRSDWASWVQAIGSVLAIIGTAGVMLWQHELQVRTERAAKTESELEVIDGLTKLFAHAAAQVETFGIFLLQRDGLAEYFRDMYPCEDFDSVREALHLTRVEEIRSPNLILAFLAGRRAYDAFHERVSASEGHNATESNRLLLHRPIKKIYTTLEGSHTQFLSRRKALMFGE